eukprot:3350614-Amphidinium_carterae.1
MSTHGKKLLRIRTASVLLWRHTKPMTTFGPVLLVPRAPAMAASVARRTALDCRGFVESPGAASSGVGDEGKMLTAKLTRASTVQELMTLITTCIDTPVWNKFHLGAAYVALVRLRFELDAGSSGALTMLTSKTEKMTKAKLVDSRGSINILWAIATLRLPDLTNSVRMLLAVIQDDTSQRSLKHQGLSNTIWAAATLGLDKEEIAPLITAVVLRLRVAPREFTEQGLSNIFWAAAKLGLDKD